MAQHITFVLGGARSGKSAIAEQLAVASKRPKIYLATAGIFDEEMRARVAAHKLQRGQGWETVEEPIHIAPHMQNPDYAECVMVVDCLTLWLSNLMHEKLDIAIHTKALLHALEHTQAHIIFVSNEVGQGIVPDNALARAFRDAAGILHQRIAAVSHKVIFVTAGIPTALKGSL